MKPSRNTYLPIPQRMPNLMKHISHKNYKTDKYYKRIVRAVDTIVERRGFVAPVDLFIEMSLLEKDAITA